MEIRRCACEKEFEVSKFAPKTTLCPECAITRLAAKRKEKRAPSKLPNLVPPMLEAVDKEEIDGDPFKIIDVYNMFGKEAAYVWFLLNGFKVSETGILFKSYDKVYVVVVVDRGIKFVVSLLDNSDTNISVGSVKDMEELPEGIVADLLPIASVVWPKGQGGKK